MTCVIRYVIKMNILVPTIYHFNYSNKSKLITVLILIVYIFIFNI